MQTVDDFYGAYEDLIKKANQVNLTRHQHDAVLNLGRTIGYDAWRFEKDHPEMFAAGAEAL